MNARDFFYRNKNVVIFDLEYTTWEGAMERDWSGPGEYREVVQIAAQMIDLKTSTTISTFTQFVQPQQNPTLSDYFVSLTGITQEEVERNGVDFATALTSFLDWTADAPKFSYSSKLASLADYHILQENIELYALPIHLPENEFGNAAAVCAETGVDIGLYSSGQLHEAFGITLTGHVHNATHDVESLVASIFTTKRILLGSST